MRWNPLLEKIFIGIYLQECPNGQKSFEKLLQCPFGLAIMRVVKSERTSHNIEKGQAIEHGKAVKVESAGVNYYDPSLPIEYLADLLDLNRAKRKSPKAA